MNQRLVETPIRPAVPVTRGPHHHFFGYYDKSPWDPSCRWLLAHEVRQGDRLPLPTETAVVGVIDLAGGGGFVPLAETTAWNFQQGAMLQWLPASDGRSIIFNDRDETGFVAVVLGVGTRERRVLPSPVYAVSPDGRYALSLDFARLHRTRLGYGYAGGSERRVRPDADGVYRVDLATGKAELILSYAAVTSFRMTVACDVETQWIEHLSVNPDGTRFLLLHRFMLSDGGMWTRLLTADSDGANLYLVTEGHVSHFCWKSPREILAWARRGAVSRRARASGLFRMPGARSLLKWARRQGRGWVRQRIIGDSLVLFEDRAQRSRPVGVGVIQEDGHCTYSPDGRWILTDTYPDDDAMRTLILYEPTQNRRIDIGRFHSPVLEGPTRCDLHPRWNQDGTQICFDSMHEGSRQVYVINVSAVVALGEVQWR